MKIFGWKRLLLLSLVIGSLSVGLVRSQDDVEDDDADVEIETEEDIVKVQAGGEEEMPIDAGGEQATVEAKELKTIMHFVEPDGVDYDAKELPTNTLIRFLVGIKNTAKSASYVVDSVQASFRYPQDFSYHIQNFTALRYNRELAADQEASVEYALQVHESFAGRPFGLTVLMNYHNLEGQMFQNVLYNETVMITEPEIGFDGETLFLYVLGISTVCLCVVVGYQYTLGKGKKHRSSYKSDSTSKPKTTVELGTKKQGVVDASWVPEETLKFINKSPKTSPRKSPRTKSKK